ncbi:MAG: hypothetical protein J7502_16845, partial [Flavisolibacter sp.]|nr:hypothetical protein [Flavisolibacter sp.]
MTNSTNQKKQFSKWRRTRMLASFIALLLCFVVQAQTVQLEQYSLVKKQWQNGNEHVSYQEGNAVPYRLTLQGLPEGNNTVTISYDITGSGSANHAIDYLGDFNTTAKFDDNTNPAADILINTPFPSSGFGDLSPYNFSQTGFPGGTMYIIGGTITVVNFVEGNPGVKNSSTSATINFTIPAGGGNVVILWGGHLALDGDYPGVNDGAGGIHGSPYHMRTLTLNGRSAGHRDRSVRVGLAEECTNLPVSGSCSPAPLCESTPGGGTATFDLTQCSSSIGSNYTSIQWYDANDVAISDPKNFLAADGTQAYAILSNDCGQSDPVSVTLHVNSLPAFGSVTPVNSCDGQSNGSVSLANSVVGTDYELKSCDGTASYGTKSGTGGTLTWPGLGAGSYKIVAINTSTTCSNTSSCVTVGVNPLPSIGTITPAPTCKGTSNGTIALATSASGINYTLQSCNGASSYGTKAGTGMALNWTGLAAGEYRIVAVNVATGCSRTSSCVTVIAAICDATLTQGFYGNVNGKNCNGKTALVLMQAALGGSDKVFGVGTRSFTLKTTDLTGSKPNIFVMLPGGGTPKYLDATCQTKSGSSCITYYPTASYDNKLTWPAVPISSVNINNNLLAQTMTLFFNVKSSASLKDVTLTGNVLTFYNLDCGSSKPGGFASTQTIPYC